MMVAIIVVAEEYSVNADKERSSTPGRATVPS